MRRHVRTKEEWNMIKRHPDLFPSFYYFKCNSLDPLMLSSYFQYLVQFFPMTTLLILHQLNLTPLALYRKLMAISKHPAQSLKTFLNDIKSDEVENIARYENAFKNIASNQVKSVYLEREARLNSRPQVNKSITIKKFDYDIPAVMNNLREQKFPFSKKPNILAFVPGHISGVNAKALSISPAVKKLISLCNGRRSIDKIINRMAKIKLNSSFQEILSRIVLRGLNYLCANGIIQI